MNWFSKICNCKTTLSKTITRKNSMGKRREIDRRNETELTKKVAETGEVSCMSHNKGLLNKNQLKWPVQANFYTNIL